MLLATTTTEIETTKEMIGGLVEVEAEEAITGIGITGDITDGAPAEGDNVPRESVKKCDRVKKNFGIIPIFKKKK